MGIDRAQLSKCIMFDPAITVLGVCTCARIGPLPKLRLFVENYKLKKSSILNVNRK